MMASFCSVNLKGMLGLLSGVLRCCFRETSRQLPILNGQNQPSPGPLTTMRVSLCVLGVSENARVWGPSGRAARLADRTAVRMRKGVSLLAMAAGCVEQWQRQWMSASQFVARSERRRVWQLRQLALGTDHLL